VGLDNTTLGAQRNCAARRCRATCPWCPTVLARPAGAIGASADRDTGFPAPYRCGESVCQSAGPPIVGALDAG